MRYDMRTPPRQRQEVQQFHWPCMCRSRHFSAAVRRTHARAANFFRNLRNPAPITSPRGETLARFPCYGFMGELVTSPIRPPSGPPPGISGIESPSDAAAPVQRPEGPTRPEAASTEQAQSATGVWIQRLEAGEVTRDQAIEGMVAQALEAHGGAKLSPTHRSELEGVLRTALLDDPVLSRLLGAG